MANETDSQDKNQVLTLELELYQKHLEINADDLERMPVLELMQVKKTLDKLEKEQPGLIALYRRYEPRFLKIPLARYLNPELQPSKSKVGRKRTPESAALDEALEKLGLPSPYRLRIPAVFEDTLRKFESWKTELPADKHHKRREGPPLNLLLPGREEDRDSVREALIGRLKKLRNKKRKRRVHNLCPELNPRN